MGCFSIHKERLIFTQTKLDMHGLPSSPLHLSLSLSLSIYKYIDKIEVTTSNKLSPVSFVGCKFSQNVKYKNKKGILCHNVPKLCCKIFNKIFFEQHSSHLDSDFILVVFFLTSF
jgi:hypothetical protein